MKKIMSLVLVFSLLFSMLSIQSLAEEDIQNTIEVYHTYYASGASPETTLQKMNNLTFKRDLKWDRRNVISVLPEKRDQVMEGIGASMTEASASVIRTLPPEKQEEIYQAYFSEEGSNYSMLRTHIGSSDFSTHEYDYAPDKEQSIATGLENFSVAEDEVDLIPALQKAVQYNPDIKIFSAPWAPPAWMKVSKDRHGDSTINAGSITTTYNHMDPQYYDLYAKYLVKYLQAYAQRGIPIFSLSMQNESQNNPDWESCYWSQDMAINFINNYLGPQMEAAGFGDLELLIWDWDRQEGSLGKGDGFLTFNRNLLNSEAGPYIDGVAFHWYGPLKFMSNGQGGIQDYKNIRMLHEEYPDTKLYATEACQSIGDLPAANFVYDIINDFRAGTNGWMEWNMVLDSEGGPLYQVKKNAAHAAIVVDVPTGQVTINPDYYLLKHLSHTIRPGDRKIESLSAGAYYKEKNELNHVAFLDGESGKVKLLVANSENQPRDFVIRQGGRVVETSIPANTLGTYTFSANDVEMNYDVATGRYATSSSYEDNPVHDYRPYKAVDDNMGSRWASVWNSDAEWLQVDLGLPMTISGVDLLWQWGGKNEYAIQVSEDGTNWVTAIVVDGTTELTNPTEGNYEKVLNFSPIVGQYVRLQGIKNKHGYGYSLFNMAVAASGVNANYQLDDTAAVNKPCQSSSYEKNLLYDYSAARAFDTNVNSRWASVWDQGGEWIQVDLEEVKNVAGVQLNWEWGWKNIYQIQTSMDGVNWTTATEVDGSPDGKGTTWNNPGGNRQVIRLHFQPTEARYVKMQGVQNKQGYGYSLYDFKVYTIH